MPGRPIDVIRQVIEYLRQKNKADDVISAQAVHFAFTLMVAQDPKIVSRYVKLAVQAGILAPEGDNFRVDYRKCYEF